MGFLDDESKKTGPNMSVSHVIWSLNFISLLQVFDMFVVFLSFLFFPFFFFFSLLLLFNTSTTAGAKICT